MCKSLIFTPSTLKNLRLANQTNQNMIISICLLAQWLGGNIGEAPVGAFFLIKHIKHLKVWSRAETKFILLQQTKRP